MNPNDPRHGTTRGYHAGCHELCCRRAMARYEKAGRLARLSGGRAVPAIGAKRRLEALMALGWSSHAIATHAGLPHRNHVWRILNGQNGRPCVWIQRGTDEWVRKVYAELSMTVPEGRYVKRTRTYAADRGYAPPLAWDDDMDDPNARPFAAEEEGRRGVRTGRMSGAELVEEWEFLRSLGESMHSAAKQLGVSVAAIEKAVERVNRRAA